MTESHRAWGHKQLKRLAKDRSYLTGPRGYGKEFGNYP
jgi:hypothetical protein